MEPIIWVAKDGSGYLVVEDIANGTLTGTEHLRTGVAVAVFNDTVTAAEHRYTPLGPAKDT